MEEFKFINMKTEYWINPIGIDTEKPVLSWNISYDDYGWYQEAYQIMVSKSIKGLINENDLVWDSNKVISNEMSTLYQGDPLLSGTTYYWKARVWKTGEQKPGEYSQINYWHTGLLSEKDWKGKWLGISEDVKANPLYRCSFIPKKKVKQAFAYISGLGHYELYMNGAKVNEFVLEPGWTDYNKTCFYNSYDITDYINAGAENVFGVMLGDGMYHVEAGQKGRYVYYPRSYGRMKFIFQAEIEYADGTKDTVDSDNGWKTKPGPITYSSMYGGEDYDARLESTDWCCAGVTVTGEWKDAELAQAPKGILRSQKNPPLKVMRELPSISVRKTKKDVYLYDLGENFSGFIKIRVKGKPGQEIIMTPGEILNKSNEPDQTVTGKDYYWKYTIGSFKEEIWSPRFTYYGFRYVEVKGSSDEMLDLLELTGQYIYPDIELNGEFSCSNELFNKIHRLINNAILSNMKSVLTDCPHREKFGWMEQSHLIGPAILYNYDLRNLYSKILHDIRDAQRENGLVPDIAPEYAIFGYHTGYIDSPEWGSASIINPWYLYKKYGDLSFLKNNYSVMKKYIEFLTSRTHHHILHHGLGDWCDLGARPPFTQNTPVPIVATAIYYMDLDIMRKSAFILGITEDEVCYQKLMREVKKEYNLQFYDDQTAHYGTGSQAAQGMALMAGLTEEDQTDRIVEELVANIRANQNGTTAGDIGHPYVLAALTEYGRSDVINDMMNVTDRPGYGYQVACNATTLTEEWDGPMPERPHGSQNHFMLGSGEEWFYSGLAGIRAIRSDSSIDVIEIIPYFADGIEWVKAWHQHPFGKVCVEWKSGENGNVVTIVIPPNARARIELPDTGASIKVNETSLEQEHGIQLFTDIELKGRKTCIITAGSGRYIFKFKNR